MYGPDGNGINWDVHSAAGFWLLGLLMLWAVTGVEFAFRQPFRNAVNAISPLTVVRAPQSTIQAERLPAADATALVAKSIAFVPGAKNWDALFCPQAPKTQR